jgi:hypothetical protein
MNVCLLMRAIGIFLSASSGTQYLQEFVETGGILNLLEILGLTSKSEEEKVEAVKLLMHVAKAGRAYKELICESKGTAGLSDCLTRAKSTALIQQCKKAFITIALVI